jgi:hypothetical protein
VATGGVDATPARIDQGVPAARSLGATAGGPTPVGADAVAGLLRELSASQITALLEVLEPILSPDRTTPLDPLVWAAVSATRSGDTSGALEKLAVLLSIDPRRAEGIASEPGLATIRGEVEALLARLTGDARLGAETRLREATEWLQAPGAADRQIGDVKASTLLLCASQLTDAGGYANYIHSAGVSEMVLDRQRWAPAEAALPSSKRVDVRMRVSGAVPRVRRGAMAERLKHLWRRAPLLVLLLGWLALGLFGGSAAVVFRDDWPAAAVALFFEIWALGFLALVGLGFYMRVRRR